ncbi:MAG: TonB-dependent receptor [Muribaculaceae bacterium]|nr:TonB-dependent receptor [Muribaculaceae bacterium]
MITRKLITTALGGVVSFGVFANTIAEIDTLSSVQLEEVLIIASRANEKTPIAFTNVTSKELAKTNIGQDIPYLLSSTPSVITTSDAGMGIGYTSLRVRGTDGSRVNVTTNGVPINDSESHNVYWVNLPDLASSVQDVQIQRGAGTSTNGAGAFGASINLLTTPPSQESYAQLDGSYGMYNSHKETLRLGSGLINKHWSFEARLSNIGTDGYIDRAKVDLYSYFAQAGYYNKNTTIRLISFGGYEKSYHAWDYASKEDMNKYGRTYNPCGLYYDENGNITFYDNQIDNYVQHNLQLHVSQKFNKNFHLNIALHYTSGDGYYEQYKTNRTLVEYGLNPFYIDDEEINKCDLIRKKSMNNGFGGGVFSLTYRNNRVDATVGGALNHYKGWHFGEVLWVRNYIGEINPNQEYYRNVGNKTDGNIYARANIDIFNGVSAYADLQYRHIKYTISGVSDTYDWNNESMQSLNINERFNFFNPKVGINWKINRNNRMFASFSVAQKEPTRDNYTDGNPKDLPRAEKLFDYELGYNFGNSWINTSANLYFMKYIDQLVFTGQLSDTGNAMSVNVPDSYRAGIELALGIQPCHWFNWGINATLSRNRIRNFTEIIYEDEWTNPISINHGDVPIAFSPNFILNNNFSFEWKGFDASLQSQFVSKQYMSNANSEEQMLDPYFVSNLHLGYTFKPKSLKNLRIGFSIYNLFNEEYENNGYAGAGYYVDENGNNQIYRYAGYAAQAPTHIMGSISIKF